MALRLPRLRRPRGSPLPESILFSEETDSACGTATKE